MNDYLLLFKLSQADDDLTITKIAERVSHRAPNFLQPFKRNAKLPGFPPLCVCVCVVFCSNPPLHSRPPPVYSRTVVVDGAPKRCSERSAVNLGYSYEVPTVCLPFQLPPGIIPVLCYFLRFHSASLPPLSSSKL